MIDYSYLYRKLNRRTPLKTDCGIICGGACCKSEDGENEMGMYLFPGEEKMFSGKNFRIDGSDFSYGEEKAKILFCDGECERREHPLSCRIFPLFPYINKFGELKVIIDKRGISVCPLYAGEINDFDHAFVRGVKHIGIEIMKDEEGFKFLYALSRQIDETFFIDKL